MIWVGTDDGNVQLTRDGGKSWTNVVGNVPGLPKGSWVSWVEASRFDAATAYAAFDRHTFGDMTPWVYRTTDFGKTWTRIVGARRAASAATPTSIKEDTVKPAPPLRRHRVRALHLRRRRRARGPSSRAATSRASPSATSQVQPRENDLVIATHGRGIWIVDDLTPLRALDARGPREGRRVPPGPPRPAADAAPGRLGRGRRRLRRREPARRAPSSPTTRGPATSSGRSSSRSSTPSGQGRRHAEPAQAPGHQPRHLVDAGPAAAGAAGGARSRSAPRRGRASCPGVYTVRLTKGSEVIETKLDDRPRPPRAVQRSPTGRSSSTRRCAFTPSSAT